MFTLHVPPSKGISRVSTRDIHLHGYYLEFAHPTAGLFTLTPKTGGRKRIAQFPGIINTTLWWICWPTTGVEELEYPIQHHHRHARLPLPRSTFNLAFHDEFGNKTDRFLDVLQRNYYSSSSVMVMHCTRLWNASAH